MRWPLMSNNISKLDARQVMQFLQNSGDWIIQGPVPMLTNGPQVAAFEREFADWLGVKYAVMVNSGASANLLTMAALREICGLGEVIVPCITWSSDIASVLHAGLTPVFVDVDPRTMGMDWAEAGRKVTDQTRAAFPTHCLGFNAGSYAAHVQDKPAVPVIEDCCESVGATQGGVKLGSRGLASNFSFYYGHHMTTIEGGMICTNDEAMYETCRVLRSHGMIREIADPHTREAYEQASSGCHPEFIFEHAGYNVRSTEINAVIGRSQLKRLDANNEKRTANLLHFLDLLDPAIYRTDYRTEGSSNFALPLVLVEPDAALMARVLACLQDCGVECRRGTAGGGNQLRQPYLRRMFGSTYTMFPQAEHIHQFGLYAGNYPDLDPALIDEVCGRLNAL
jgi:CDP-6-deoxy-D-xylo-4-hexulose-3-dehydrase